jgi:oligopeptide/dipeptide ABC transporter ATP-binding protein
MKQRYGLTLVFIAHDLAVVKNVSDRIAVMYLGRIVEFGDADLVAENPLHPYTQALFSAAPPIDPDVPFAPTELHDDPPDAASVPSGCAFHPRCAHAMPVCAVERPEPKEVHHGQRVACHLY